MKVQYFENIKNEKQLMYLRNQNHCALCGHALEFKFEKEVPADNEDSKTQKLSSEKICEVTVCPECEVQSKSLYYVVQ